MSKLIPESHLFSSSTKQLKVALLKLSFGDSGTMKSWLRINSKCEILLRQVMKRSEDWQGSEEIWQGPE